MTMLTDGCGWRNDFGPKGRRMNFNRGIAGVDGAIREAGGCNPPWQRQPQWHPHFRKEWIILSLLLSLLLFLAAALIARYPFAVAAARSPLSLRSNPQPGVSQPVQVHT